MQINHEHNPTPDKSFVLCDQHRKPRATMDHVNGSGVMRERIDAHVELAAAAAGMVAVTAKLSARWLCIR